MQRKYQELIDSLAADIRLGRYQSGQKLPSEAALVKKFNTSRITVGRALRELQQKGLIERVAGSGSYVRGEIGKDLLFGLLIPDLGETEILDPICHGISMAPEARDHALLWGHGKSNSNKEEQCWDLCRQFISRRASGVFYAPLEFEPGAEKVNRKILAALHEADIPVVLLDRHATSRPERGRADLVGLNNRQAGYLATEHLIRLGCTRIGFLAHQGAPSTVNDRMAGHQEALRVHGLAEEVRNAELEAFVCLNDHVAGLLMHAFLSRGIRIPEDVRIVGIDGVRYADLLPVPLTTVRQPCTEIGEAALRAMLERIRLPRLGSREILLDGELIIRQSCGASKT